MNSLRNRVHLIGHLGADPDVKNLEGGKKLAKFSLATSESYRGKDGEKVQETQWHNCVAWGKLSSVIEEYLTKGNEIAVEGKLVTNSWEDKNGTKRYKTEVIVSDMLMLKTK